MDTGTVRLRDGVVAQTINGEMVLLDTQAGRYYDLNASGTRMLEALIAGQDREEIVAALRAEYAVAAERVRSDLDALLASLHAAGLVEDL